MNSKLGERKEEERVSNIKRQSEPNTQALPGISTSSQGQ